MEFIIYIDLGLHFKMLGSTCFRNLDKTRLISAKPSSVFSSYLSSWLANAFESLHFILHSSLVQIIIVERIIKQVAWFIAVSQSLLIIASRKHYTVDVVVAWYTVNLVVFFVDKNLPELPDRTARISLLLLPVSIKDKNGWNKEENHKLLNGNSVDPADWRLRTQVNGKVLEDGNNMHDNAMNGA
ncbi:hypothetical protein SAY87_022554 [Trapa incisa]|uniref:Sphingomyelin synthase-like domain-containing protein n=1 Tax=Trapa incisa TaxID=236973 RepID=A0AAN7Q4V9_9MYRT|nr:hypothetical protein SAY87_022554 [Trapa incisa]